VRRPTRPNRRRPKLGSGESILTATEATATGTGRTIATGTAVGVLAGLLYSTSVDNAAPLPSLVAGGFVGVLAGYLTAWLLARSDAGPGAVTLLVVMTNRRLILLRRGAALRTDPLREFPPRKIVRISARRAPIGSYQRVEFFVEEGTAVDIFVRGRDDFPRLLREHTTP